MIEKNQLTISEKIKVDLRRYREAVRAGFEARYGLKETHDHVDRSNQDN